jgi:hypothetical protein
METTSEEYCMILIVGVSGNDLLSEKQSVLQLTNKTFFFKLIFLFLQNNFDKRQDNANHESKWFYLMYA